MDILLQLASIPEHLFAEPLRPWEWQEYMPLITHTPRIILMILASAGLCMATLIPAAKKFADPSPSGVGRGILETLVLFLWKETVEPALGKEDGEKLLPVILTFFFFILYCNLLGLIPGSVTATGNVNVTAALALLAFVFFNGLGMHRMGIVKYWLGLVPHGVPGFLWPVLFVVEIIGVFSKTGALCVRLFANMVAGHASILGLMTLIGIATSIPVAYVIGMPVTVANIGIGIIEILIAFLQAYIFAFLVTIFASQSLHPH